MFHDVRRQSMPYSSSSLYSGDRAALIEEWNEHFRTTLVRAHEQRVHDALHNDPHYIRCSQPLKRVCACGRVYHPERWVSGTAGGALYQCPRCRAR